MVDTVTPPVLERHELKYLIPAALIEPISAFVSVYCSLDIYSQQSENRFYGVNNLYLDTPSYLFLRNRLQGAENRFNMRIRSYGDNPDFPYYLEVKQKRGGVILKYRGRIFEEDWEDLTTAANFVPRRVANNKELRNIRLFQRLALFYNIEPKVFTQYTRKAYISDCEEYARVTFDVALRYMAADGYRLAPVEENMIHYDHPANFDQGCNVILEMKCYTTHVPLWMIDCIRRFDLKRRSFSKYATGVREVLGMYQYDTTCREPSLCYR